MSRAKLRWTRWVAAALSAAAICMPIWPAAAINYGSGTYGSCQYGSCSITITSNGTVGINVTPSASGSCTTQSDNVAVLTNNSAGYTLTLNNADTNTSLRNGAESISTSSATMASPATLSINTWGYRVDSMGGFGAGPTSAQTNGTSSIAAFAGVPASNSSPDTIANTNAPANPAVTTTVWYGVCANTAVKSGTYTTHVTYTAVTN